MTLDKCDPCSCTPGYLPTDTFYQNMVVIGCGILDALTGGGAGEMVQVTSVIPGTGALNLGKAHNALFTAGDVGVFALGVRDDNAATAINSTTGHYGAYAVDVNGKFFINKVDTVTTVTTVAALTAITNALPAGTNLLGKVGIDQTTPGTTNGVVVKNNETLVSKGGSVASSGNNTLVVAGTNKLKVYAFSLSTNSTTEVVCQFQSGASGTVLWEVTLQAVVGATAGANLAVSPPAWLFNTASATLLNLNLSAAQTVHYSVSYFDEA